MKNRIEELADQCHHRYSQHNIDLEKFAELLVRECADFVQFYYKDHSCEVIANDMKTHFGLEK